MGISGTASFCQVVNHLLSMEPRPDPDITIHLFETREDHFATGAAYRIDAPAIWTLNNPAKDFKFIPDIHPLNVWIAENRAELRRQFPDMNEEFCPRAVVGHFLKAHYASHKSKAEAHGIKVIEHFEQVLEFDALDADRWGLKTQTLQMESDFLFLCFGHIPAHHYPDLESKPGYFSVTTPLAAFDDIPSDAPIHILGGQASFVDYAVWLAVTKNHQGTMTSLTRNPSIITTKGNPDTCDTAPLEALKQSLLRLTPCSLPFSSARDSFWRTYKAAAKDPVDPLAQPSTSMALSYQLAKYEKRAVLPELTPCGNIDELRSFVKTFYFNGTYEAFWTALTYEGKESFNRLMFTQIMAYLTGITPVNTQLLLELYNSGQVMEKSGLTSVGYDEQSQEFLLYFAAGETEKAKYLIDTSGYSYDIRHCNTDLPLLKGAVAKGLLVPKPFGGIEINDAGQPINLNGKVQRSLFCVGPVASFGDKYPTPHASFLVFNASDTAATRLSDDLKIPSGASQSFSNN
ncbi:FAD/NAD(P)-binding protein [Legionella sp. CNM-4043-24]|uniref:FAD/NAD(P)-binding protein n=1 Tax=Legionella sp. CNM-4043-24 TaxID=3421646 RepID=UPI00403AD096